MTSSLTLTAFPQDSGKRDRVLSPLHSLQDRQGVRQGGDQEEGSSLLFELLRNRFS